MNEAQTQWIERYFGDSWDWKLEGNTVLDTYRPPHVQKVATLRRVAGVGIEVQWMCGMPNTILPEWEGCDLVNHPEDSR